MYGPWIARARTGASIYDDESISDGDDDLPVTPLRPLLPRGVTKLTAQANAAALRPSTERLPGSKPAFQHAFRVERSRGGRAKWSELSNTEGSMPPLDTMSLSTLPDSCPESVRERISEDMRPGPVSTAERIALNSLCANDTILPMDIDGIVKDLEEMRWLDELARHELLDDFVERFTEAAPQMLKPDDTSPRFGLEWEEGRRISISDPKVLPWLESVEEPTGSPISASPGASDSEFPGRSLLSLNMDEFGGTSAPRLEPEDQDKHCQPKPLDSLNLANDRVMGKKGILDHPWPDFGGGDAPILDLGPIQDEASLPADDDDDLIDDVDDDSSDYQSDGGSVEDSHSTASDYFSHENIEEIGRHAAERLFGPDFEDSVPRSRLEGAVQNFISEIVTFRHGTDESSLLRTSLSGDTDHHGKVSLGSSSGGSSLKRKASKATGPLPYRQNGDDDDQKDQNSDRRGNDGNRRPAEADNTKTSQGKTDRLEFMCPFRLKDPMRFNVREWYDCATKIYVCDRSSSKRNELNELRRHIKQKHSGPGILSQPYCSTCKEEFPSSALLDEHARERTCLYREFPTSDDPFDGLSPEAERALRSKQGRQGDTPINQYRQICQIVFGENTEVPSPGYLPVIEHFELQAHYMESLPMLRDAFRRKLPFQLPAHDLEALLDTVHNHTVDVFGQCNDGAVRNMASNNKRRKTCHRRRTECTTRRTGSSAGSHNGAPTSPAAKGIPTEYPLLPKPGPFLGQQDHASSSTPSVPSLNGSNSEPSLSTNNVGSEPFAPPTMPTSSLLPQQELFGLMNSDVQPPPPGQHGHHQFPELGTQDFIPVILGDNDMPRDWGSNDLDDAFSDPMSDAHSLVAPLSSGIDLMMGGEFLLGLHSVSEPMAEVDHGSCYETMRREDG